MYSIFIGIGWSSPGQLKVIAQRAMHLNGGMAVGGMNCKGRGIWWKEEEGRGVEGLLKG